MCSSHNVHPGACQLVDIERRGMRLFYYLVCDYDAFLSIFLCLQVATQILEFHGSLGRQTILESKLAYIRAWEGLQDFGISYFIVKFQGYKPKDVS